MLGEGRGYAAAYMKLMADKYPDLSNEFTKCSSLLKAASDCAQEIGKLSEERGLNNRNVRCQIAAIIRKAAAHEKEACEVLNGIITKLSNIGDVLI